MKLRRLNNIPEKHIRCPLEPGNSMNGENVRGIVAPLYQSPFSWTTDILFIRPPMQLLFQLGQTNFL